MEKKPLTPEELDKLLFQARGGWPALLTDLFIRTLSTIVMGALIHIGWNLI